MAKKKAKANKNPALKAEQALTIKQLRAKVAHLQKRLDALKKIQKDRAAHPRATEARLLRWRVDLPEGAPPELVVSVTYTPKTGEPIRLELNQDIAEVQHKTGRERVGTWTATVNDTVRYKLEHESGRVVLFGKTMPVAVPIKVLPVT
jgi:hypothetical protein